MDDVTFAKLVDASEADAIAARIYDAQPNLLSGRLPSDCYFLIDRALNAANAFAVNQAPVRQHLATMALYFDDDFCKTPEIQDLLSKVKNGHDYILEVQALPDSYWGRVASKNAGYRT